MFQNANPLILKSTYKDIISVSCTDAHIPNKAFFTFTKWEGKLDFFSENMQVLEMYSTFNIAYVFKSEILT